MPPPTLNYEEPVNRHGRRLLSCCGPFRLHLCNANKRTGTTTFEWAPGFAPASASELAKGLHALTWNDRPLDQWARNRFSAPDSSPPGEAGATKADTS